jgi:4-oxalomesaconate tautomerase
MNLGDVSEKSVPKMTMVSPPKHGGTISTRTFIPHRCHTAIGVLGAISVATACLLPGSPAAEIADIEDGHEKTMPIEHPTGEMTVVATVDSRGNVQRAAILRTARKLFDGLVFAH